MGRIVMDEGVCRGKPVIKGTRLTVEFVLELLANGWSTAGITENYPQLNLVYSSSREAGTEATPTPVEEAKIANEIKRTVERIG
ncbi:MAG: DUF433 domain-containing protein [Methanophagales archaeon]|nr:DUF433 domain-containing protein [Methanophagales archaeon]